MIFGKNFFEKGVFFEKRGVMIEKKKGVIFEKKKGVIEV